MSELTRAEWLVHRAICETEMDECAKERGACVWAVAVARPGIEAEALRKAAEEIRAEAADTKGNGWLPNETYRAQKIYTRLRERAKEIEGGSDAQ